MVYFQTELTENAANNYTPVLKKDDLLAIHVIAENPEVAELFNLPPMPNSTNSGYTQGNPERNGYLIDEKGNINVPILGLIHVEGLKRNEAVTMIEEQLRQFIKGPVVNIQILNYKVTVLGDVKTPGTFKIPNERITILEALGLAGDINVTGKRKNVVIIREKDGKKEQHRVDLTNSNSVFNSPVYYLEQNDVVYVEHNVAARTNSSIWKTTGSIFISTAAVIISTINVLSK